MDVSEIDVDEELEGVLLPTTIRESNFAGVYQVGRLAGRDETRRRYPYASSYQFNAYELFLIEIIIVGDKFRA